MPVPHRDDVPVTRARVTKYGRNWAWGWWHVWEVRGNQQLRGRVRVRRIPDIITDAEEAELLRRWLAGEVFKWDWRTNTEVREDDNATVDT